MSLRGEFVRLGTRAFLKWRSRRFDLDAWRTGMRATKHLVPHPPARCHTTKVLVDRRTLYRIETDRSHGARHLLYLHGGAYISGAPAHYRHFTWRIADAFKACVWALEYRLAPEHPFPAALDDAVAAHTWLLHNTPDASRLFVMGDSAGGGLMLGLLLRLRDEGRTLPSAGVALSPWTDLALTGRSLRENAASDPMLNAHHLPIFADYYLAGADPRAPYASPLYGNPGGLPPVLIQVGGDEILRDDAVRMAEKLQSQNPLSRLEVWPRMPHVWQLFVPFLPEANRAIAQIGDFIADVQR
ncbi:alpha/beta hydrolase [Bradyrhizobium sp. ARR65]|uniref:alpha/beta hydrolase n=1 Tax=Bradyrhizobium sp. ARR65 TaxID=1040989 RepID=UPI000463E2A0|nr:alpha/beta hydrolase [Bradyrhizobium sp. ARR65]